MNLLLDCMKQCYERVLQITIYHTVFNFLISGNSYYSCNFPKYFLFLMTELRFNYLVLVLKFMSLRGTLNMKKKTPQCS